ncbi:TetR/AcrR family transcriptional regulator [Nocardioides sp.]|uniref:TetR/AcrR family transcriptional regulator n=1 Tax=Nocardioides sp. TaxID=35761 RepID=UPI002B26A382|nr:TetR/AcrR family transcriptional regulator [Nocardioides sp.]
MPSDTPGAPASDHPNARFVEAALDLFLEHGYNGTSLAMIGDRLGVSKAAVTYHFHSKDELLAAVVAPALDELRSLLDDAESIKREGPRRKQALTAYVDYLIRQRRVAAWLSRDVGALAHSAVFEPAGKLNERVDALLIAGTDPMVARIWGAAVTQALVGPILTDTEAPDAELRDQLIDIGNLLIRGHQSAQRRRAS